MQPSTVKQSSYVDELGTNVLATGSGFRRANLDPRSAREVDGNKSASIAEENNFQENDNTKAQFTESESVISPDLRNLDEFTPYNPLAQEKERDKDERERRKRQQRRIGSAKRVDEIEEDLDEEQLFGFLVFLDSLWIKLSEIVESVSREFENWSKWFKKKEKKVPPALDKSRISYIREEFNAHRSPHLWKSNPDRKWILTFGHAKVNNVVSNILYKYQNETISKDA